MIFQQPNFFGCLEAAPDLAAAANERGRARRRPRRPDVARRARGARRLRLRASRSARARRPATARATAGRTTASSPSRTDFIRRLPGRIVGETTDLDGRARLRAHAADARAAHPPREGDLEHDHEPDAARARRASSTSRWLGPQGLREVGETCMALAAYARERHRAAGGVPERRRSRSSRCGRRGPARDVDRAPRASTASIPATRSAATTRAWTTSCSSRVTEKRTPADIDRLADVLAEVCG